MIPVRDHLDMLSAQYLASALRPGHPANEPVCRPARRREKKQTLQSRQGADVAPHLVNGSMPNGAYPAVKNALHTSFVTKAIANQGNHPLLNQPTPEVNRTEKSLPRHHRTTLSQLRSGHCASLASYKHRVGRAQSPSCPECRGDVQDVPHLFNCNSVPTDLTINDLWLRPRRVASFISNHPSFTLPPLVTPPPRPPPEPPP